MKRGEEEEEKTEKLKEKKVTYREVNKKNVGYEEKLEKNNEI
jgi:hypothetical protein